MKIYNRIKGTKGEINATTFLKKKKYRILETNYTNSFGEIDIICQDKDFIVFVEVKQKSTLQFGLPREMVDKRKQQKIGRVASAYLKKNRLTDYPCRFDVVEIIDDKINYIENAFEL